MFLKRILSVTLSLVIIFVLTSCQKNQEINESETASNTIEVSEKASEELTSAVANNESTSPSSSAESPSESASATELTDDPSLWSKVQIVEAYKNAAKKSDSFIKCKQSIELTEISINNGQYSGVIDFVMPIMSKLLANNSSETDGITGGYANLTEADVANAKVYKSGENTVIELIMVEQTDGAVSDANSGSVGHAISTVGDITVVANQLKDLGLPIEISKENTAIYYTKPTVKVTVDKDGKIVEGSWSYTVDIRLKDYYVGKSKVDSTRVVMNNVITAI